MRRAGARLAWPSPWRCALSLTTLAGVALAGWHALVEGVNVPVLHLGGELLRPGGGVKPAAECVATDHGACPSVPIQSRACNSRTSPRASVGARPSPCAARVLLPGSTVQRPESRAASARPCSSVGKSSGCGAAPRSVSSSAAEASVCPRPRTLRRRRGSRPAPVTNFPRDRPTASRAWGRRRCSRRSRPRRSLGCAPPSGRPPARSSA